MSQISATPHVCSEEGGEVALKEEEAEGEEQQQQQQQVEGVAEEQEAWGGVQQVHDGEQLRAPSPPISIADDTEDDDDVIEILDSD